MFYPSDYEVKLHKEREIRERVQQAAIDRLARELRPKRASLFIRGCQIILRFSRYLLHGLDRRSAVPIAKTGLAHRSNAIQKV